MKIRFLRYTLFLIMLPAIALQVAMAQETRITGSITDASTGEPIPFVNIYFRNTTIGAMSDLDGKYSLFTHSPADTLCASAIGFVTETIKIRKGVSQVVDFKLKESLTTLQEVMVRPDERWIELLMKRIFKSKDLNNPDRIAYYQCEAYNKIQIDLNNIDSSFTDRKIFKPIDFIFNYIDTSSLNQKVFLPALITESISDYYFRSSPRTTREYIKASQISGIDNQSFTQYLGGLFLNLNIYDNYLNVFDKNFVSPLANFGLSTYEYYLDDTILIDGRSCYQIRFEPKRKHELTFYGTMWIQDTTFAVRQIELRMAPDANFNWVNDFYMSQTYEHVNGQYWALTRDYRLVDMNPLKTEAIKTLGIFGHRTTIYSNYIFDQPKSDEFYSTPTNVIVEKEAFNQDREWWAENRPDTLKKSERQIYEMIDSVKSDPAFKRYEKLGNLIGTAHWMAGDFEIGPLYKFMSFNDIEGVRLRFGGRTNYKFSKKIKLEGHIAYGTKDQEFKYGLEMKYLLNKDPRRLIGLAYKYDMEQLGADPNAFSEDNFFASFFRRSPADKLTMVHEYKAYYEHEWFNGFSNAVRFIRRDVYAIGDDKFIINDNGKQYIDNSLVSNEIQLYTRFAYRERFVSGAFEKSSLGTKYPIVELLYGYGIPGFPGSDVEYNRLHMKVSHWFNIANIGWSKYILETGKIWGTLPYPFLKIHNGNETFFFYTESGNLMNYYEFISDTYATLFYTHHFDGLLFNKIPLMRKLQWREVVHGRAVWGTLTDNNKAYSEFPVNSGEVNQPYFEAGVGIENISRIGRIDAIWRLNHLEAPDASPFGIFISMYFSF